MATIDWAFLCDYAFVDGAGKASIIGTFENIFAGSLPTKHPQLYVALGLKLKPGESFDLSSKMSSPSGKEVSKVDPIKVAIPSNAPGTANGIVTFGYYAVEIKETGIYHIEIFIDTNSVHVIPLNVVLQPRPN